MRKFLMSASILALSFTCTGVIGQDVSAGIQQTGRPLDASQFSSLVDGPITASHLSFNQLSASANAAVQGNIAGLPFNVRSLPVFSSFFRFQGQKVPFTMVGKQPQAGGTTQIDTSYLAISFSFDEFKDAHGNNIVIDATGITNTLLNGPDFQQFQYTNGFTQFGDAVQRAEFADVIAPHEADNTAWHTVLNPPRQLAPVTVEVPVGAALVFQARDGNILAVVDFNFLIDQLNNLLGTETLQITEIPIWVTRNTVYATVANHRFRGCCIGGFHTAFGTQQTGNVVSVQVFDFATSIDAGVAAHFFRDPTFFADVEAMSHEISETFNDPFVNNVVPRWEFPGLPFIACSSVLETGDPVENLANPWFAVTLNGFTYHPQTEALLQWFSRESPSSAFGGAYSYPGNNLTSPSTACPAGH